MKPTMIPPLIGLCVALFGIPAAAQEKGDIDKLHELVRQTRSELKALREQAGIRVERGEGRRERRREGRGEHGEGRREGRGEHGEGRREGRGEHGEGRREGRGERGEGRGEESGKRLGKYETWDQTRKGARLILAYNPRTQSFKGTVQNATTKHLSQVRVEVHLSNGVELGPTKRIDLEPGKKIPVELSAANQKFEWWTTHPEHGNEEGHGPGHGREEGRGEHAGGEGAGNRPKDPALRPLYNDLLLLRREVKMLREDLRAKRGRDKKL